MKLLLVFLIFSPILGFSQVESQANKSNYSDADIQKFIIIKRENVSPPISDDEVIDMVNKSGMTLEEYGQLIRQSFSSENGLVNAKPKNDKEQKLVILVDEKNLLRAADKEKKLKILCEKHGLSKSKYDTMDIEVNSNMTFKTKVIEALNSTVNDKR